MNMNIVGSIFRRDLKRYFSNPTGYVFITLFIFLSAAAAFWQKSFFLSNLANLDQLNGLYPLLLVFFIPSLTMGIWAEEKKQGTQALLLTLPAHSSELVLGKYFAALGIYTAALLLSLSHIAILMWLGSPDPGLMAANYLGYWVTGAALLSVAMITSLFTRNVTISFISGVTVTALAVYFHTITGALGDTVSSFTEGADVFSHFDTFAKGIVSFDGIIFFLSLTVLGLSLNTLFLEKHRWHLPMGGLKQITHLTVRTLSLIIALVGINMIAGNHLDFRADITSEGLYSLLPKTRQMLKKIPTDRAVTIRAYLSPQPPAEYARTRKNLISFLREIDAVAGPRVRVSILDTKDFTETAADAEEKYSITPRNVPTLRGEVSEESVYMGVVISSGTQEQVIPFFEKGLPVEYELIRSISVVTGRQRPAIGIVKNDLKIKGDFDYRSGQRSEAWEVVDELKKQYEIKDVSAEDSITQAVDALLVPLPSLLTQKELDNLKEYVLAGTPALFLADPLPIVNPDLAPAVDPNQQANPYQQQRKQEPAKGDIESFFRDLGIVWNKKEIVWDAYNPHPKLNNSLQEIIFSSRTNDEGNAFNDNALPVSDLQEVVTLFPGSLSPAQDSTITFTPLMRTGTSSGTVPYDRMFQRSFFGMQLTPQNAPHVKDDSAHVLAAYTSKDGNAEEGKFRCLTVADIDFISSQFFNLRKEGIKELNFDNVSFFLNSIDFLTGDTALVKLRKKRAKHRTLTTMETMKEGFIAAQEQQKQQAEEKAAAALEAANRRLEEKITALESRSDLDQQTKAIMVRNARELETRRFEAKEKQITARKERTIERSRQQMLSRINGLQNTIKMLAVALPPVPVLLIGIFIFIGRRRRERDGEKATRKLKE
ncbi:MAG: Gldg family protein [Fibrobacterota bacterium]